MFSEVRSRLQPGLQRGDSEIKRTRRGGPVGGLAGSIRNFTKQNDDNDDEPITEEDVHELKKTTRALRKQLQQIVDDEIPSNNEACGVAINGMVLLREELVEKKSLLQELRTALSDAKTSLEEVASQTVQQREERQVCEKEAARMKDETDQARTTLIDLKADIKQRTYFQENVDTETMHRLRADVENLKIEQEMDEIRLRHLNFEKNSLKAELEDLVRLRDAHGIVACEARRELSEAKMTREMYQAHNEALCAHLQSLGGHPNNMIYRFRGFFGEMGRRTSIGSKSKISSDNMGGLRGPKVEKNVNDEGMRPPGPHNVNRSSHKENDYAGRMPRNSILQTQQRQRRCQEQQLQQSDRLVSSPVSSQRKITSTVVPLPCDAKPPHAQVGGIVQGSDRDGASHSDFLRKLPTIFKMGSNVNNANVIANNNHQNNNNIQVQEQQQYARRRNREVDVEFNSDSNSVSAISVLTMNEDDWTDSDSENEN